MHAEVEQAFDCFASLIQPGQSTMDRAAAAHAVLRSRLAAHPSFGRYHADSFLGGSYRRNTAPSPLKDVDVFVILNADHTLKPRLALSRLSQALSDHYPAKTALQRRSIRIDFSRFSLDVVPVIAPLGPDRTLRIPDRELERWVETNPKGHIGWVTRMNEGSRRRRAGKFVPLVKMMKSWRRHQMPRARRPKGFALECWIGDIDPAGSSWGELVESTLTGFTKRHFAASFLGGVPAVPDPGMGGWRIAVTKDRDEYDRFIEVAGTSLKGARLALKARTPEQARHLWSQVFGPWFT